MSLESKQIAHDPLVVRNPLSVLFVGLPDKLADDIHDDLLRRINICAIKESL
jgi:hypothetical protein